MAESFIKEFSGRIIGIIRTEENGDQAALDFPSRRVLGFYRAKYNHTTDFVGRVVAQGNTVVNFIYEEKAKQKNTDK